jgi:flagellar biosynthesis protein FlhB
MEMRSVEISALETLGSDLLYLLFAAIINIAAALVRLHYIVAANAVFLYIMAVGIVLFAIFAMIRPHMRELSEVDDAFRICYTSTTLLLVGLVIMVLGLIVLVAVSATAGFLPETTGAPY